MIDFIKENNKKIIIIIILIIISITLSIIISSNDKPNPLIVNSYVIRLSSDLDYNLEECDFNKIASENEIPYFKINDEVYNKINEEILTKFISRVCYQEGKITYKTSLNDNILSVLIIYSIESGSDLYHMEYKSYNIDINNNSLIDNQTLLSNYDMDLNDIENIVQDKLKEYYNYEKTTNYFNNESFTEYLKILKYEKINYNNMNIFINKNKLYLYKTYSESEAMILDDNYPIITYEFKLN